MKPKREKLRIVCGTDFSVHAAEAAKVAAFLAMNLEEALLLVNVVENGGLAAMTPKVREELLIRARENLHREAEHLRGMGATVKEEILSGSAYERLVECGGRPTTRMLVVSSLGQIAPSRFLVGSVAERTAEAAPVPTLVVRGSERFEAWDRGDRPLKVLVGIDFSASSDVALRWARDLRDIGPCEITVAHVYWPPEQSLRLGMPGPPPLPGGSVETQNVLIRDLKRKLDQLIGSEKVQIRLEPGWGRLDLHLLHIAKEIEADLIVVGTHQRHGASRFWLGSVSRGILHHAPISVAVVPARKLAPGDSERIIPELRRVLVTTDFSELGNRAVPFAYSNLPPGAAVHLLHIVKPSKKLRSQDVKEIESKLHSLMPEQAEARGITSSVEVLAARNPATAICQAAERCGADLICMASHGRSGLSKMVAGSVASGVMSQSKRPLLLVRVPEA